MAQIHELTMIELAAAIRAGELSPVAVTDHYLRRTQEFNDQVGAFYTVTAKLPSDQALPPEKPQPAPPECGLRGPHAPKTGPPARTPWALARSAGGSSGGAAAAVAAGLAPAAQGSDGGGSIRIPASVCGLFGIKPSRGRISGGPLMPDLAGLSTDGPIARTVEDAALLLDAMSGNYPGDMYIMPPLPDGETFLGHARREPGKLRIGRSLTNVVPGAVVHDDCVAAHEDACKQLPHLPPDITVFYMPSTSHTLTIYNH